MDAHLLKMEVHILHFNHKVTWQFRCAKPAYRNCCEYGHFWIKKSVVGSKVARREVINLTMLALWNSVVPLLPFPQKNTRIRNDTNRFQLN